MSFSIIPSESKSLMQLKMSVDNPIQTEEIISKINPLEFLSIEKLDRSKFRDYYSDVYHGDEESE